MAIDDFHDPLTINLKRQRAKLLSVIPSTSSFATKVSQTLNNRELLATLSELLAAPSLTECISTLFRPLLIDLCARWIDAEENTADQLIALCLLIEVHEELFPVLYALIQNPVWKNGLLTPVFESIETLTFDVILVQRLLLAYYRILTANRPLPSQLCWPLSPLSRLIWASGIDNGVRMLAIQCYSLQTGMVEAERVKIEREVFGEPCEVDCNFDCGESIEGKSQTMDGWVMPLLEVDRVRERRRRIAIEAEDFYAVDTVKPVEPISPDLLCPRVANICGVFMLRARVPEGPATTDVVLTPTTVDALRSIALHLSLRLPVLLTSPPSSGKSMLVNHLANALHPGSVNQIVYIYLADTSLDARSLLGSYVSSPTRSGTFEWKDGILVRAMREGKWVMLKDIDRGSNEVLGVLKPLVESMGPGNWIGQRASLSVPNRGMVTAADSFRVFASRSVTSSRVGELPTAVFFGAHKFFEIQVPSPSPEDLKTILGARFPRLAGAPVDGVMRMWKSVCDVGIAASTRDIGLRDLEKFCARLQDIIPSSSDSMETDQDVDLSTLFTSPTLREDIYVEARDIFFGAGSITASARTHTANLAAIVAQHVGIEPDRQEMLLQRWTPHFDVVKDINGNTLAVRAGRSTLSATPLTRQDLPTSSRPFAMHRPAICLLSRIATAVAMGEPVLLTGETGTGKTSAITHLATILRRPLISLNMSHQTESADLVGGFKPIDARIPASDLQDTFFRLFGRTFSRKKNEKFEAEARKAVLDCKWKRAVALWRESARMAKERIQARQQTEINDPAAPRKRQKVGSSPTVPESEWASFEQTVTEFEVQHIKGKSKFAFDFVEGPLVKAMRNGHWILLDELNLASPETLECISGLLHSPTATIILTERGSLEHVPRHPDFRMFACMNPATDVGKRDLPPNIRCRFTEIDVPPPDTDRETLIHIIEQYIGDVAVGDKASIVNVADFYSSVKELSEARKIADGSNHRPHFSMRTLARALTFTADTVGMFGLRRALWEGCLMAFTMVLIPESASRVTQLARTHLLASVKNIKSLLSKEPAPPSQADKSVKLGHFYLERGPLPVDSVEDYVMTPSVEAKLVDLSRIILTRRVPILIEGPTSSGKTSSVEYLARRTGHRFVRINNHEHTDIQEYIGSYIPDPTTGKLVFRDGLLVRALRNGDWIVLDELNLAPTEVLEALNRLLDDNRELVIPETLEVVRPHPNFLLFATQNPPGLYAGRKVLSRAFRNRFLEVHFDDVPQNELETILCQRCRIAPSYGKKIVKVFSELQKRRQLGRVFESKQSFATLRDLFRWAGRDAVGYQELAENGYMLIAERARREDDKMVVKEVIEDVMGVKIDGRAMYDLVGSGRDSESYLGCSLPSSNVVWTAAMQRLYVLLARALRFNEPVLLVGETGCGKTSACEVYAETTRQELHTLNCHQNTETADLIGGLRPIRNRAAVSSQILASAEQVLQGQNLAIDSQDGEEYLDRALRLQGLDSQNRARLEDLKRQWVRSKSLFGWHDGPLVTAMRCGEVFLLDEISLADDSVLERLNSVLEPSRELVLAEKGGDDLDSSLVVASPDFKLVATMNPGGDFGKKELSPALRNRFTEIWVPAITSRRDFEMIVNAMWNHEDLRQSTSKLLDFIGWLEKRVDAPLLNMRDILAWVQFSNTVYRAGPGGMPLNEIFHHGAHLAYLDGLGTLPNLSGLSREALLSLRMDAVSKLTGLMPGPDPQNSFVPSFDPLLQIQLGSFSVPKGKRSVERQPFHLGVRTTQDNAMRVFRACQLPKPILLEGSPGVGKTSLIAALANVAGYELHRINLSDQTDLMDLFGSDLPVEGGAPGEFEWKDAEFLSAMQEGHWVLLDEMNLAPQAILEGLNAVLDHRGVVFIPELGRSFQRHSNFRVFAAQNPFGQGGGRKGLPKSFLNRFTKVYVEELTTADFLSVTQHLFPDLEQEDLYGMIAFNAAINDAVTVKRLFAASGSPWEFNLRDIIRWSTLMRSVRGAVPLDFFKTVYLHRFRSDSDRQQASRIYEAVFRIDTTPTRRYPTISVAALSAQIGRMRRTRSSWTSSWRPKCLLKMQAHVLESLGYCIDHSWPAILTGRQNGGKSDCVRVLADLTSSRLVEVTISSTTDTMDLLGGFEQIDSLSQCLGIIHEVLQAANIHLSTAGGSQRLLTSYAELKRLSTAVRLRSVSEAIGPCRHLIQDLQQLQPSLISPITDWEIRLAALPTSQGRFEWVDGPLLKAMKEGHWLLLDGANLCSASVLDRLNSLCEPGGYLTLTERGYVNGAVPVVTPHCNFRLFFTVDPRYGELSRAMRNRGVEICVDSDPAADDPDVLADFRRFPLVGDSLFSSSSSFELLRRGLTARHVDSRSAEISSPGLVYHAGLSAVAHFGDLNGPALGDTPAMKASVWNFSMRVLPPAYVPWLARILRLGKEDSTASIVIQFLQKLRSSAGRRILHFRDEFASSQVAESIDMSIQPIDFFMRNPVPAHSSNEGITSIHRSFVAMLEFIVQLFLEEDAGTSMHSCEGHYNTEQDLRTANAVKILVQNIRATARDVLNSIAVHPGEAVQIRKDDLFTCLRFIMGLASSLEEVCTYGRVDLSVLQALSRRVANTTSNTAILEVIAHQAEDLNALVSPSIGLGLTDIWQSFIKSRFPALETASLRELDLLCSNTIDSQIDPDMRKRVFEFMALEMLRPALEQAGDTENFLDNLRRKLGRDVPIGQPQDQSLMLATELSVVANYSMIDVNAGRQPVAAFQDYTHAVCSDPGASLVALCPHQHFLWGIDAGDMEGGLDSLTDLQMRWMKDFYVQELGDEQPTLLRPVALRSILSNCEARHSLAGLEQYGASLRSLTNMILLQSMQRKDRLDQLEILLETALLKIWSCFDIHGAVDACKAAHEGITLTDLLRMLQECENPTLCSELEDLSTALASLHDAASRVDRMFALALCFVAVFSTIYRLYVPDRPIDPSVDSFLTRRSLEEQIQDLTSQIQLHRRLELNSSGNANNEVIAYLETTLEKVSSRLAAQPRLPSRSNPERLHMFWSEVHQFRTQIVQPDGLAKLMLSLKEGDTAAQMQERMVQQSVFGFCQRLDSIYPDFRDVSLPLQFGLLHLPLGLHLARWSHASEDAIGIIQLCNTLVTFPTVRSTREIDCLALSTRDISPFNSILLRLGCVGYNRSLGADTSLEDTDSLLEQAMRLWLMDQTKRTNEEAASQSLYRSKTTEEVPTSDDAREEEEFLALFPTFEDAIDNQPAGGDPTDSSPFSVPSVLGDWVEMHRICVSPPGSEGTLARDISSSVRQIVLDDLLRSSFDALPDMIDSASRYTQLQALQRRIDAFKPTPLDPDYNFYSDANAVEAKRAATVLKRLRRRLDTLIEEWPDQMVLQHLRSRCEAVLALDSQSPLAKILAGIEQLLLQTDDWEIYANRQNSLTGFRQELTGLVIEWRRLELTSWQGLLATEARSFQTASHEWWFRLYDALVRGPLGHLSSPESDVSPYLDTVIPLIDEFVETSPLGQFEARMSLLNTFHDHCKLRGITSMQRILRMTLRHFRIFSSRIEDHLNQQQSALEKEIKDYIKLASWKDVNVQALKQSARRTHHQLYKIVRKFRDLLRQPIRAFLILQSSALSEPTPADRQLLIVPWMPSTPPPDYLISDELATTTFYRDVSQTWEHFKSIVTDQIRPVVDDSPGFLVESLSIQIISTAQRLSSLAIPDSDRREKLVKSLQVRKRKAWSDLLKELKRVGVRANVKADILERQQCPRWWRIQPIMPQLDEVREDNEKAESYYIRLSALVADVRGRISNHHPDVTTRDLNRGLMFTESACALVIDSRARLAVTLTEFHRLQNLVKRLRKISTSSGIHDQGPEALKQISDAHGLICRLCDALREAQEAVKVVEQLSHSSSSWVTEDNASICASSLALRDQLSNVIDQVKLTTFPVILDDERDILLAIQRHLHQTTAFVRRAAESGYEGRIIFAPFLQWLSVQNLLDNHSTSRRDPDASHETLQPIIDSCLIAIQKIRASSHQPVLSDDEEPNNWLWDGHRDMLRRTIALDMTKVLEILDSYVPTASRSKAHRNAFQQVLPFLEEYIQVARHQLVSHTYWQKSLSKLTFVICSVVNNVAQSGFCKPPEAGEDGADGAEMEASQGTGLGEGSGNENVSKDIEEESQVEGLQGMNDETSNNPKEPGGKDDTIEMSEDFAGELEDVPDDGEDDVDRSDDEGSQEDPDEGMGDLDQSDPDVVDEKLWGDKAGDDSKRSDQKLDQDRSQQEGTRESDIVAREGAQSAEDKKNEDSADQRNEPEMLPDDIENGQDDEPGLDEGHPDANGAPFDDQVPDANTLDLPDDLDLGGDERKDEKEDGSDDELDYLDAANPEADEEAGHSDEDATGDPAEVGEEDSNGPPGDEAPGEEGDVQMEGDKDTAIGEADVSGGSDPSGADKQGAESIGQTQDSKPDESTPSWGARGKSGPQGEHGMKDEDANLDQPQSLPEAESYDEQYEGIGGVQGLQQGHQESIPDQSMITNPLRSLGDARKEVRQRLDEILARQEEDFERATGDRDADRVEYLTPDDEDQDMQVLGPAGQEQVAKLAQLRIVEEDVLHEAAMNIDEPASKEPRMQDIPADAAQVPMHQDSTATHPGDGIEGAIPHTASYTAGGLRSEPDVDNPKARQVQENDNEEVVEAELRSWHAAGLPESNAEHIWQLYSSLTNDLSFALCEQLRLILEPTRATRLKGDYRTGKRLNMKKIIPYIASDFTKDKIWLRRTKPSQREYQVFIALDDSRSMAESHSVHLAYQTLALIAKALSRLEVGDVGIARFGETVDVLHGFDGVPFSDQAGSQVMQAFKFNQTATDVLSLVSTSLRVLEDAREKKATSSATASDLWQLEMIISDGMCQDHDRLRSVLRKAEEQRVMVVFIIIDSLLQNAGSAAEGSILSMERAEFKNIDGRMELQLQRYLDSFPFEYYVVLRNVESLPEVLSSTLKQFFERISEE